MVASNICSSVCGSFRLVGSFLSCSEESGKLTKLFAGSSMDQYQAILLSVCNLLVNCGADELFDTSDPSSAY
jgi:hypothetical protein